MKKKLLPTTGFLSKLLIMALMLNCFAIMNPSTNFGQSLTDILQVQNRQPYMNETFSKVSVNLLYSLNTKHPRITIEKNGKIYGTTVDSILYNEATSITINDSDTSTQTPVMSIYADLYIGEHIPVGKYDLVVDDGTNKEVFIDKLIVHDQAQVSLNNYMSDYNNLPGQKQVYVSFNIKAGDPKDFSATLMDKDGVVIANKGTFNVERTSANYQRGKIRFDLEAGLDVDKAPYQVTLKSTKPFIGDSSERITLSSKSSFVIGSNTPDNPYATFNVWLNSPVSKTIIAELSDRTSKVISTQKIVLKNSNHIDLQFLDAKGQALKLSPGFYSANLKFEDGTFIENLSKSIDKDKTQTTSYVSYSENKLYAGVEIPNSMIGKKIAASALTVEYQNVIKELPPIKLDNWTIKEDRKLSNNNHFLLVEKTIPQTLPKGNYFAIASYEGKVVFDTRQENVVVPVEVTDFPSHVLFYNLKKEYNGTLATNGFVVFTKFIQPKNLKLQLIPIGNKWGEPIAEIALTESGKNSQRLISKENTKGIDLYKYYNLRIVNNGKIVHALSSSSEYIYMPSNEAVDSKQYTIKSGSLKNGTLSFNMTKGLKRQEIVVLTKANPGYQYKPNSVKVNGKPIDGRFFILKENAVVTAEFEPINQ